MVVDGVHIPADRRLGSGGDGFRIIVIGLNDGERRLFQAVFATADQKEGMAAFVDKRPPGFVQG